MSAVTRTSVSIVVLLSGSVTDGELERALVDGVHFDCSESLLLCELK